MFCLAVLSDSVYADREKGIVHYPQVLHKVAWALLAVAKDSRQQSLSYFGNVLSDLKTTLKQNLLLDRIVREMISRFVLGPAILAELGINSFMKFPGTDALRKVEKSH